MMNIRHKNFADEYMANGKNGTRAYLAVYKSVKSEKVAEAAASRLLSNVIVKEYIDQEMAKSSEKLEIKREDMLQSLHNRAKLVDEMQALANKEKLTATEESRLFRLLLVLKASDGNKAWDQLARSNGWNAPEQNEVTHKGLEGFKIEIIKKDDIV